MDKEICAITTSQLLKKVNDIQAVIDRMRSQIKELQEPDNIISQIGKIVDVVEEQYGLPKGALYEQTQKRIVVEARQMTMFLAYYTMGLGVIKTGIPFKRDYRSVLYSLKTMRNLVETNSIVHDKFINICNELEIDNGFVDKILTKN
jgi:chromosomal replication initiation ATPase DnaA